MTRTVTAIMALLLLLPFPGEAQQRKSQPRTTRKPAAKAVKQPAASQAVGQLAEQLKLVNQFLYVYGKVAASLDDAEQRVKRGEAQQEDMIGVGQSKAAVLASVQDLRAGIGKLAAAFRTDDRLKTHTIKLIAAAEAASEAEQLIRGSRYDDAGRSLLVAAARLVEVLAAV